MADMASDLHDIRDRDDIVALCREFYSRGFRDELLGPVFVDVARLDLDTHLPVICDFWETVLLDARNYRGGAFAPHVRLHQQVPLTRRHFDRWLAIWHATVDDLFTGQVAEDAKFRATRVADAFHGRLSQPDVGPVYAYRQPGQAGPGAGAAAD